MRHWADSTRHWSIMFMKCILYPWWKEMAVKGRTGNDDGDDACAYKLALHNIGWSRTERIFFFRLLFILFIYFKICTYRIYTGVRTKGYSIPYKVQPPKCMWRHRRPLVTEINMAGYGDGRSTDFFKECSLSCCDAIYRRVLLFVRSMNHIPPYLLLSLQDDDDVRDIGKRDFRPVILRPM